MPQRVARGAYTAPVLDRERLAAIVLTLASGLAFGLAFPPLRWHALAWCSLAPLFVALRTGGTLRAVLLVWLWCLAAAWSVGDWFPRAVAGYFGQPMPVAIALFFAVFTVMAGPYYLAAALAYRALARRFALALPFLAAAAWVMAELGRGRLFTGTAFFIGNPWGLVGYSHADVLPLAQVAEWTGIYGLGFLIVAVNAALAEVALAVWRRMGLRTALFGLVLMSVLPAGAYGVGAWRLAHSQPGPADQAVTVAVLQGNISVGAHWRADAYGQNLDTYLGLTEAAANRDVPRVAFWPEAALAFFLEEEEGYRRRIGRLLATADLQLVTGGPRRLGPGADEYSNSVYVVEPGGAISGRYDKEYLVPFAEYFPLDIDLLRRRFGRIRSFDHGVETAPLSTRAGLAGVLVCNEAMLPEAARKRVLAGAEILVNPTNDSWISDEKYTAQQLDFARMRAIEQRRWVVRASTAGPSALIDPWGRTPAVTDAGVPAVAVGEVWPRSDRTLYARIGDTFAAACVLSVVLALAWSRRALALAPASAQNGPDRSTRPH